jgi:hypothetical protein
MQHTVILDNKFGIGHNSGFQANEGVGNLKRRTRRKSFLTVFNIVLNIHVRFEIIDTESAHVIAKMGFEIDCINRLTKDIDGQYEQTKQQEFFHVIIPNEVAKN